jgi:Peptidase family M23
MAQVWAPSRAAGVSSASVICFVAVSQERLQGDNGVEYFYAHLSGYAVSTGTRVRAGQLITYNGQTGNARYTAPNVHFEGHLSSSPVNPTPPQAGVRLRVRPGGPPGPGPGPRCP